MNMECNNSPRHVLSSPFTSLCSITSDWSVLLLDVSAFIQHSMVIFSIIHLLKSHTLSVIFVNFFISVWKVILYLTQCNTSCKALFISYLPLHRIKQLSMSKTKNLVVNVKSFLYETMGENERIRCEITLPFFVFNRTSRGHVCLYSNACACRACSKHTSLKNWKSHWKGKY